MPHPPEDATAELQEVGSTCKIVIRDLVSLNLARRIMKKHGQEDSYSYDCLTLMVGAARDRARPSVRALVQPTVRVLVELFSVEYGPRNIRTDSFAATWRVERTMDAANMFPLSWCGRGVTRLA